jgi:Uma2 family endonuclease
LPARTLLTYADYAALPDDGRRYELHAGELSVTPAPGTRHQTVILKLVTILHRHVDECGLGRVFVAPTDCILSDHTVVQPDILFVARDRLAIVTERAVEGAPTLVVEVLSPSTAGADRGRKRAFYAAHGVGYYWTVDPGTQVVEAERLVAGAFVPAGRLNGTASIALPPFPGLLLDGAAIWA